MLGVRSSSSPVFVTATLLGAALVAWIVTVERMEGMDAGPGTSLGGLGWYLGIWLTMHGWRDGRIGALRMGAEHGL